MHYYAKTLRNISPINDVMDGWYAQWLKSPLPGPRFAFSPSLTSISASVAWICWSFSSA